MLTLLLPMLFTPDTSAQAGSFAPLQCLAKGTVGFHDYAGGVRSFEPAVFHESVFYLEVNSVLTAHLGSTAYPKFLTLIQQDDRQELECTPVRGSARSNGLSCQSQPPTTILLYNPANQRFTRSSAAAWTFSTGTTGDADPAPNVAGSPEGESLFIEYGSCREAADAP